MTVPAALRASPAISRQPRPRGGGLCLRFVPGGGGCGDPAARLSRPGRGGGGKGERPTPPPNNRTRPPGSPRRARTLAAASPAAGAGPACCSPHRIPPLPAGGTDSVSVPRPPLVCCQSFAAALSRPRVCNGVSLPPRRSPCTRVSCEVPRKRGGSSACRKPLPFRSGFSSHDELVLAGGGHGSATGFHVRKDVSPHVSGVPLREENVNQTAEEAQ